MFAVTAIISLVIAVLCAVKCSEKAANANYHWNKALTQEADKHEAISNQLAYVGGAILWAMFAGACFMLFLVSGALALLT